MNNNMVISYCSRRGSELRAHQYGHHVTSEIFAVCFALQQHRKHSSLLSINANNMFFSTLLMLALIRPLLQMHRGGRCFLAAAIDLLSQCD